MTSAVRSTLASISFLFLPVSAIAQPLLVDGKATTFQRVLTKPGATMETEAGGQAGTPLPPFQPYYVFGRADGRVQVGPSISGEISGWIAEVETVAWKQNIVAAFTNPSGRERELVFSTVDHLLDLMNSEDVMALQADLLAQADTGRVDPESGVIAVEPDTYINIREQLYLMPILDFEEDYHPLNQAENLLMETAAIPLGPPKVQQQMEEPFDAGIVFVLDTTKSMGPYIESTKAAVERIVRDIGGTDLGSRVQFGVVGFRDDTSADPEGIGYRTKVLAPLDRRTDQSVVISAIQEASAVATASTPGFNEDSMAGIEDAVAGMNWAPKGKAFDAKYIILITDAGPNDPSDPLARSRIGPAELQADAEDKGIAILTLHLRTPAGGEAQHTYAEAAYRQLSIFSGSDFYYPIENGDASAFDFAIGRMVTALVDTIRVAMGQAPAAPQADEKIAELGRAMQLAWLGGRAGATPPDILQGWVSSLAIEDPRKLALEPRLLVTKNEMATMAELLDKLLVAAEQTRSAEDNDAFFDQVQTVIASMAENPDRLVAAGADTPGGALEFLVDLPYHSQVMAIDRVTWGQSATQRRQIMDGMHQKLVQYRKWLVDPEVWTALYDGAPDGELVYAMPFDVLP